MAEIPVNTQEATAIRVAFIKAATWHGTLEEADAMLAANPWLAGNDIHTAAILGDDEAVQKFITQDAANVTALTEPYGADALVCLCLSKYLRLDKSRSDNFLRAATALLNAGANANSGFWTTGKFPEFETALYGAAGVAQHAGLTRLLVERGADVNDVEVTYHSPETYNNEAMKVLLESGKLNKDSLATMLLRKADWHDYDGMKLLLEHGADPNHMTHWGYTALHQALRRDNDIRLITLMLDNGGDPAIDTQAKQGQNRTGISIAARRGRGDALNLFTSRGMAVYTNGVEGLIVACALNDGDKISTIRNQEPGFVNELLAEGNSLLPEFAGTGNIAGMHCLLSLGVDVNALYDGDGYFEIAKNSTALDVAAWRAWPGTVSFLIERGADVHAVDDKGRTPLMLAVRAGVSSYWMSRRTTESIQALLQAGADAGAISMPTGWDEADKILEKYRGGV